MKDGAVRFNPGPGNPNVVRPAGPVDDSLPVLLFRNPIDNKPFASLTTFAMHTAVFGGTEFGADFPSVIQTRLQKSFGDDFVSLFAEGTAGDINHIEVGNANRLKGFAESRRIGNAISDTILRELSNEKLLHQPSLAVAGHTAFAPFQPVTEDEYLKARADPLAQQSRRIPFKTLVNAWRNCHGYRYAQQFPNLRKPLEVQAIRLDKETAIVTLPHEVFVEIGLPSKPLRLSRTPS